MNSDKSISGIAYLQLARAFVIVGEKFHAEAAYEEFFVRCGTVDSHHPVLAKAKLEYERLKRIHQNGDH